MSMLKKDQRYMQTEYTQRVLNFQLTQDVIVQSVKHSHVGSWRTTPKVQEELTEAGEWTWAGGWVCSEDGQLITKFRPLYGH
jgi:hypothetical protein